MGDIEVIAGGVATDDRGKLQFINGVDFSKVKRFYIVSNHTPQFVRAWHCHLLEGKFITVVKGSAVIGAVKVDDVNNPDKNALVTREVLSENNPKVMYIPPGYANGAMTLTEDTRIMYFSTATLEESKTDDYRFSYDYWSIWGVERR